MLGTSRRGLPRSSGATRLVGADRWITALADPPMAPSVANAAMVGMSEGLKASLAIHPMRRPVSRAMARRRLPTAAPPAAPDKAMPGAS
jgi:hypothetical protein